MIYKVLVRDSKNNEIFNIEADSELEARFECLSLIEKRTTRGIFENPDIHNLIVLSVDIHRKTV